MDGKVRFGILGFGVQGSKYAGFLTHGEPPIPGMPIPELPHCALGAICDADPERVKLAQTLYPSLPVYTDWRELVQKAPVDAVITTVPHYLHPEMGIYCLEHGMPVLIEKPAGVYAKAVRQLNECAAQHPEVAFGVMFNQRTNVLYQRIREEIVSGALGELRRTNWIINSWWRTDCYYRQSSWRATWGGEGGGVLVNQAPHQLDLWQWMCGIPTKVYAKCLYGSHRDIAVENDVTILTEYANGATGTFITCTHDPLGTDRLEIDLDRGKIVVEDSARATIYRFAQSEDDLNASLTMEEMGRYMSGNSAACAYTTETLENRDGWGVQHCKVLENFAQHLLDGTPLLAPGTDGIHGVNLCNAALLSSWLNREVELPVDEEMYLAELNKRIRAEGKFPTR